MEPKAFLTYLQSVDANEWVLLAGISIAIIIGLLPSLATLLQAKRRLNFHTTDDEQRNQMLYTVYRDPKGKIKVFKH